MPDRQLYRTHRRGFTLIELMIVAAILGILSMIAIPKFADMIVKAQEASALGKLGTVRSAFNLYYADTEGMWPSRIVLPSSISSVPGLIGSYLDEFPEITLPRIRSVQGDVHRGRYFFSGGTGGFDAATNWQIGPGRNIQDGLFAERYTTMFGLEAAYGVYVGRVWINCRHTDSKGRFWSDY